MLLTSAKFFTVFAEEKTYDDGVTVVKDEESPSGYTAHFVYDSASLTDEGYTGEVTKVVLATEFVYVSEAGVNGSHSAYDYKNGDFVTHQDPKRRGRM